jgi:signal transduction histidine kinase
VDLLVGAVSTTVALYALLGAYFAITWLHRREETHFGIVALMCAAVLAYAVARVFCYRAATADDALAYARLGFVGLVAAFALLLHFALRFARVRDAKRWLLLVYVTAAAYEVFNARGLLYDLDRLGEWHTFLGAMAIVHRGAPLNQLGLSLYALAAVATVVVLALLARTYLAGRREALPLVVGTTVVLAAVVNDIGFSVGFFATAYLVEIGFVGVALGLTTSLGIGYTAVSNELDRKSNELRTRTRELRASYEELRAAQEELVRKEQLAVVGELAAVIAHEVRNPLAIIANAVAGLRKTALSREDHTTLLTILDEETSRLNRLVSDLLRYARPVNVQRTQIQLGDLLERGLSLARDKKGLNVELKVEAAVMRLWGDANLLRQVFDNLIDNAVQAMTYGGTLTVRIRVAEQNGQDGLAVDIIDTGEGMDTQVRSRARDPFFTTRPSGTGLGLAIVDRIVDAHGGQLVLDSRAGEGTTVTVFLPYGSPSEPPPKPKGPRVAPGASPGILGNGGALPTPATAAPPASRPSASATVSASGAASASPASASPVDPAKG